MSGTIHRRGRVVVTTDVRPMLIGRRSADADLDRFDGSRTRVAAAG